jgi:hypothetical protein
MSDSDQQERKHGQQQSKIQTDDFVSQRQDKSDFSDIDSQTLKFDNVRVLPLSKINTRE